MAQYSVIPGRRIGDYVYQSAGFVYTNHDTGGNNTLRLKCHYWNCRRDPGPCPGVAYVNADGSLGDNETAFA